MTAINQTTDDRATALAEYFHVSRDTDVFQNRCDPMAFDTSDHSYLVLTEDEADARVWAEIRGTLWAFRPSFLCSYIPGASPAALDGIQLMQEKMCEDCNEILYALVSDRFDALVRDAILADGRGHFLAHYDSEEIELGDDWLAYRTD